MIEKFNGIIYLIIFIIHFAAYAFYAFKCVFATKAFVDQYGMGDGAAIMTRFFGSIFIGSVLMALYIMFISYCKETKKLFLCWRKIHFKMTCLGISS